MKISLSPADFWELILSHHPNYPCFDDDVIILSGRRICAGCLFAYPTALVVYLVFHPSGFEAILIAFLLAILSPARRLSKNRTVNFAFRFLAGIALGFGIGGLLWAIQARNLGAVLLVLTGGAGYALLRIYSMQARMKQWEKGNG